MRRAAALIAAAATARGDCTPPECYVCDNGQCMVSASGVEKSLCQAVCLAPPPPPPSTPTPAPPPAPTPAPTPPPPPPRTPPPKPPPSNLQYFCNNGACMSTCSGGVSKDVCTAVCSPVPTPAPPPNPAGFSCDGVTSVSMKVHWPEASGSDAYELEWAPVDDPCPPGGGPSPQKWRNVSAHAGAGADAWGVKPMFASQTSTGASQVVVNLLPATEYVFRVRAHSPNPSGEFDLRDHWADFQPAWKCATSLSPAAEPRGLRRVGGARNSTHASISLAWDEAPGAAPGARTVAAWDGGAAHQWGQHAAPLRGTAAVTVTVPAGAATAELTGLAPGRLWWVRVGGSDATLFRTPYVGGTRTWQTARVTTDKNRVDPEPGSTKIDFLSYRNSGDIPSDVGFLMSYGDTYTKGFEQSLISVYCVDSVDDKWAVYSSCNDHERGCSTDNDTPHDCGAGGACSGACPKYQQTHPGRMEVCDLPGLGHSSKKIGYWYSTTGNECHEGKPVGTDGCTWSRRPSAVSIHGHWLSANGWTKSKSMANVQPNTAVIMKLLNSHPSYQDCV